MSQSRKAGELHEKFASFYQTQWGDDDAYGISDFAHLFGIDNRLSRYYLMKLVDEGKLSQVKIDGNTWYMKPFQAERFKEFRWIGIRVIGDTGVRRKDLHGHVKVQRDGSGRSTDEGGSVNQAG